MTTGDPSPSWWTREMPTFAIILGFIVDAIHETLDAIKKGRCNVVEDGHLLVLGWTDACYLLLREVALALEGVWGRASQRLPHHGAHG